MNFILLLTIASAICSIISFFTSQLFKSKKWVWCIIVFILTFVSGCFIHKNSELERIKNIHRQAAIIYEHYNSSCFAQEYIQEALVFLEENRETYPDAYERAKKIFLDYKNSEFKYAPDPAIEMRGIIKGIAALNN